MERMETLALDCLPAGFEAFFLVLGVNTVVCPLLRTLIVGLPEGEPAVAWKDLVFKFAQTRASRDSAIKRLRVTVPSEGRVPLYPGVFGPFVQEIEIIVPRPGRKDGEHWLV